MSQGGVLFSDEQEKAISRRGHTVVRAGAGSGKTRVIVEWYCKALLDYFPEARIDQVVAVTFTEKAAGELKTRISQRLHDLEADCREAGRKKRIEELRALLPLAPIGTIHSLCARILRDFWREAGIEPTFIIVDELRKEQLISEAIEQACNAWQDGAPSEKLRLAALLSQFKSKAAMIETLRRMMRNVAKFWPPVSHLLNTPLEQLAMELPKSGNETFAREVAIATTLREVAALFEQSYFHYRRLCSGSENWLGRDYLDFAELELRTHRLLSSDPSVRALLRQTLRAVIVDEYQDTSEIQWEILQKLTGLDEEQYSEKGPLLYVVGDPLQSIYSWRQAKPQIFETTAQRLRQITATGECEVGLTTNFRTRERVLDVINEICRRIFCECPPSPDLGQRTGDRSPSDLNRGNIYVPLHPSNASTSGRVLWVTPRRSNNSAGMQSGKKTKKTSKGLTDSGEDGETESGDGDDFSEARRIVSVLRVLVSAGEDTFGEGIGARPRLYGWRDVAILCRKRSYFSPFEAVLATEGIPYRTISSMGFYDQQEIVDLVTALRAINEPEDDFALLGFLRGGLVRCSDATLFKVSRIQQPTLLKKCSLAMRDNSAGQLALAPYEAEHLAFALSVLERAESRVGLVTVDRLVEDLLEQTGAWGIYALGRRREQAWANVQKFLTILRSFKTASVAEVLDFLETEGGEGQTEGEAPVVETSDDAVKLMTIHAAKGLEFPIVVLASLDKAKQDPAVKTPLTDGDRWFVCDKSTHSIDSKDTFPLYAQLEAAEKARQIDEEKRVFYVALTRAKDYLVLSTTTNVRPEEDTVSQRSVTQFYKSLGGVFAATWAHYRAPILNSLEDLGWQIQATEGSPCIKIELDEELPTSQGRPLEGSGKTFEETLREKSKRAAAFVASLGSAPASPEGPSYDFPTLAPTPLAGDRHLALGVTEFLYFLVCPKKYFEIYVAETVSSAESNEETPDNRTNTKTWDRARVGPSKEDKGNSQLLTASEKGSLIHAVLAEIFEVKQWDPLTWPDIVRKVMGSQMPYLRGETGEVVTRDVVEHLRKAWTDGKFTRLASARWARFEQPWAMEINDELHLSGTIDCEFENEAGEIEIADFKTGIEQHEDDFLKGVYENQIKIYLLMIAKRFPDQKKFRGTLIHTAPGKQLSTIEMERDELRAFEETLCARGHELRDFLKRYAWGNLVRNAKLERLLDEECLRREIPCPMHHTPEH